MIPLADHFKGGSLVSREFSRKSRRDSDPGREEEQPQHGVPQHPYFSMAVSVHQVVRERRPCRGEGEVKGRSGESLSTPLSLLLTHRAHSAPKFSCWGPSAAQENPPRPAAAGWTARSGNFRAGQRRAATSGQRTQGHWPGRERPRARQVKGVTTASLLFVLETWAGNCTFLLRLPSSFKSKTTWNSESTSSP